MTKGHMTKAQWNRLNPGDVIVDNEGYYHEILYKFKVLKEYCYDAVVLNAGLENLWITHSNYKEYKKIKNVKLLKLLYF